MDFQNPLLFALYLLFILLGVSALQVLFIYGQKLLEIIAQKRAQKHKNARKKILLRVKMVSYNEKGAGFMEQLLSGLHSLYKEQSLWEKLFLPSGYQDNFSFEITQSGGHIATFIWTYEENANFIESQVYAQYPEAQVEWQDDYMEKYQNYERASIIEYQLKESYIYPIETLRHFQGSGEKSMIDPFASLISPFSSIHHKEEQLVLQYVLQPAPDTWQKEADRAANNIKLGKKILRKTPNNNLMFGILQIVFFPVTILMKIIEKSQNKKDDEKKDNDKQEHEPTENESKMRLKATEVEQKSMKTGFYISIRAVYLSNKSPSEHTATGKTIFQSFAGAFKQYASTFNAIIPQKPKKRFRKDNRFRLLHRITPRELSKTTSKQILNTEEVASLFHFPTQDIRIPNLEYVDFRKLEPPINLPLADNYTKEDDLTSLGHTNFRGHQKLFGIKPEDRARHLYAIGKTGMGKSVFLENLACQDVRKWKGVCIIDPHGETADTVLSAIPPERKDDVVLFDPSDTEYPVAFNMFETDDESKKPLIASQIVMVLKHLHADSWGPRLEYILRNTVLALLDFPDATFLGILRMYTDEYYRNQVVKNIQNNVVKRFWVEEFGKLEQKQISEQVGSIQNKVGQFLSSPMMRNILGQSKTSIDVRKIMDEGKILIVNLSKGKVGEDNSMLLGSMMITKIQLDAMSRADIDPKERREFFLYIDEFQNFATESFETILSEARKYRLSLNMANQYVSQMCEGVRDAVFGNVWSIFTFQVWVDDAPTFVKQYSETLSESDLIGIAKYKYYTRMLVDGMPAPPFSADALPPTQPESDPSVIRACVAKSREKYGRPRSEVESEIASWEEAYKDPNQIAKEEKEKSKKEAYEAKKAELMAQGKWDPANHNKQKAKEEGHKEAKGSNPSKAAKKKWKHHSS